MTFPRRSEPCPHCEGTGQRSVVAGIELAKVRKRSGLSLRKLADRIGVTAAYLHDVEHERRRATDRVIAGYQGIA